MKPDMSEKRLKLCLFRKKTTESGMMNLENQIEFTL